jgi:protein involved in polysaccharide export with SLBB domain
MRQRLSITLLVVVAVLGGGGCSILSNDYLSPVAGEPDRLGPGERLVIIIAEKPPAVPSRFRLDRTIQVDGTVALVSNKVFTVAGKTLGEFRREVRAYYVPTLFKSITIWGPLEPSTYYVGGEVQSPGRALWKGTTTLRKAITAAGGFTASANTKKVQLTRADGEQQIINCTDTQQHPEMDVEVHGGDYIIVPRSFWK